MTAIATSKELITPEDLLGLPDLGRYDALIDGELKERCVSVESSHTSFQFNRRMGNFLEEEQIGWGFQSDCGLQIFPWAPGKVRFADGGFYRKTRGPRPGIGHLRFAPDLVLEVVSPGDDAQEVEEKVDEYLRAGVTMVWVAYPVTRHVLVFTAGRAMLRLGPDDELTGGDVLPGFAVAVKDFFLPVD